jgi:ATP-dependent DNA helicase
LRDHNTAGPYLIAGPLATLGNWKKEFEKWLPNCPILLYHGSKPEREELRKNFLPLQQQKTLDFPIVITSFEMCMSDRQFLERYLWQYIILDEGHRIKNRNCKLLKDLKTFQSVSRLLLTGTPIQNSLEELWSLLNFCSPMIFDDLEVFKSWFGFKNIGQETRIEDILSEEERDRIVSKLHEILRPFVLRRIKKDTLADLVVDKKEIVIYCGLSSLQKEYYDRVLDGSLRDMLVELQVPHAKHISLLNANMNLRKVCNHPFLFGDICSTSNANYYHKMLVTASGKFRLLDRMLPRLLAEKHKIILFSQMTEVLNLIEDYLQYKDFSWVRLDGSTKLVERQESIDAFNDPTSNIQIFLLSTRAGGLGINLTAADTAILFDSDWNPHMDEQAQSRCHRIGQTKPVLVYRLLTNASVEIDMMKKQISKKKLERLAIVGGDFAKAGRRVSNRASKGLNLEDLKRLLMDDIRRVGLWTSPAEGSSSEEGENEVDTKSMKNWTETHKEISNEELDMIMDRDRLFSQESDPHKIDTSSLSDEMEVDEEGFGASIYDDIATSNELPFPEIFKTPITAKKNKKNINSGSSFSSSSSSLLSAGKAADSLSTSESASKSNLSCPTTSVISRTRSSTSTKKNKSTVGKRKRVEGEDEEELNIDIKQEEDNERLLPRTLFDDITKTKSLSTKSLPPIPLEGEMYDIVVDHGSGSLLLDGSSA